MSEGFAGHDKQKLCRDLITSTLENFAGAIKQNKLRKLICKGDPSITWTLFATALDDLIKSEKIVKRGDNEVEIAPKILEGTMMKIPSKQENTGPYSRTVKIPKSVAEHLQKKNNKKIKNVEKNTNTLLTLTPNGDGKNYTVLVLPQLGDTDITKDERADERNKKRVNFAASLLIKMVKLLLNNGESHDAKDRDKKRKRIKSNDDNTRGENNNKEAKKKRKRDKYY